MIKFWRISASFLLFPSIFFLLFALVPIFFVNRLFCLLSLLFLLTFLLDWFSLVGGFFLDLSLFILLGFFISFSVILDAFGLDRFFIFIFVGVFVFSGFSFLLGLSRDLHIFIANVVLLLPLFHVFLPLFVKIFSIIVVLSPGIFVKLIPQIFDFFS